MSPQRPFQLRRRTNRMSWPKKFPTTSSLRKFLFSLVPSSRIWGNYRKSFFSEALFDWNQFCQNFSPEQIEFVSSLCQLSKATFLVTHYTTWLLVLVLAGLYLTSIAITMMKRQWDKLWCFKIWAILILPTKFIQYTELMNCIVQSKKSDYTKMKHVEHKTMLLFCSIKLVHISFNQNNQQVMKMGLELRRVSKRPDVSWPRNRLLSLRPLVLSLAGQDAAISLKFFRSCS